MEVWWRGGRVKLASVVLLGLISNQNQVQIRLQDEQNNELKAWINLKSKHSLLAYYSLSLTFIVVDKV